MKGKILVAAALGSLLAATSAFAVKKAKVSTYGANDCGAVEGIRTIYLRERQQLRSR